MIWKLRVAIRFSASCQKKECNLTNPSGIRKMCICERFYLPPIPEPQPKRICSRGLPRPRERAASGPKRSIRRRFTPRTRRTASCEPRKGSWRPCVAIDRGLSPFAKTNRHRIQNTVFKCCQQRFRKCSSTFSENIEFQVFFEFCGVKSHC